MQKPKSVLVIALTLNGLNIILDYYFIFVRGMGAAGAGYATMISEWAALIVALLLIAHASQGLPKIKWKQVFDRQKMIETMKLNTNIMLRTLCLITTFATFTNLSASMGTVVLAGNAILLRLLYMVSYFIDGFAYALEALAGEYKGANNLLALKRALKMGLKWNVLAVLLFAILLWFFRIPFLHLLTNQSLIIEHTLSYLPNLLAVILVAGFAFTLDGYFIGLTEGAILRNNMVISTFIGFMPLALAGRYFNQNTLLWWGLFGFMLVRAIGLARRA